jgi:histone-lysine N-methyltransferase SETMAR
LIFLKRHHKDGDEYLSHIFRVRSDESWVSFVNVETKEQSKQRMHIHSPTKPKRFKQTSAKKMIAIVFWDSGIHATKDHNNFRSVLRSTKKLCRASQNKRRGILTSGVVFLHDNAHPHTIVRTRALLNNFNWELFDRPPYSLDLAPSDYHLFTYLKNWLG